MNPEQALKLLQENAKEWMAFIIRQPDDNDVAQGFGEDIIDILPEPSEENNWLYDEEKGEFKGQLVDESDRLYDFVISERGEDDFAVSVKPTVETEQEAIAEEEALENLSEPQEEIVENVESQEEIVESVETQDEPKDEEIVENGEPGKAHAYAVNRDVIQLEESKEDEEAALLREELKHLREKMSKMEEAKKQEDIDELHSFCECLYKDRQVTEEQMKKDHLKEMLTSIYHAVNAHESEMVAYSEGDKSVDLLSGIKGLLTSLPGQVNFSESTTVETKPAKVKAKYSKTYSKDSTDEHSKILSYMKDHNMSNTPANYRRAYQEMGR